MKELTPIISIFFLQLRNLNIEFLSGLLNINISININKNINITCNVDISISIFHAYTNELGVINLFCCCWLC